MALNLENWKSNYYLNNILKLDEVYDEIQSTFNNESIQNEFILFDSSKLTTLSNGYNLIENNSTDSIYVISNILVAYQSGDNAYSVTGDIYIGLNAVPELPTILGASKSMPYINLTIGQYDKVLNPGSSLGIISDSNAVGGDGELRFIVIYNKITTDITTGNNR